MSLLRIALLSSTALSASCALFSHEVSPQVRQDIEQAIPAGTGLLEAEAALNTRHFNCARHKGPYVDGDGHEHAAERVLACTRDPGRISMACNTRDQVFVLFDGDRSRQVFVLRGPSCSQTP